MSNWKCRLLSFGGCRAIVRKMSQQRLEFGGLPMNIRTRIDLPRARFYPRYWVSWRCTFTVNTSSLGWLGAKFGAKCGLRAVVKRRSLGVAQGWRNTLIILQGTADAVASEKKSAWSNVQFQLDRRHYRGYQMNGMHVHTPSFRYSVSSTLPTRFLRVVIIIHFHYQDHWTWARLLV